VILHKTLFIIAFLSAIKKKIHISCSMQTHTTEEHHSLRVSFQDILNNNKKYVMPLFNYSSS